MVKRLAWRLGNCAALRGSESLNESHSPTRTTPASHLNGVAVSCARIPLCFQHEYDKSHLAAFKCVPGVN